ncbi:MAG: urease accessory protein [Gammaproteobacteria bacterium]|jgi:urease accessory protein
MLELTQREQSEAAVSGQLTLDFESRQRSRLRTRLDDGREAAILLERGQVLRGGERLRASTGEVVLITAANELLSEVRSDDARELVRAAYHLGNRHVAVEVGASCLRYAHDHVLDDMLRGLGLAVSTINAGFEPEAGAYAGAHTHSHPHDSVAQHSHGDSKGDSSGDRNGDSKGPGHAH